MHILTERRRIEQRAEWVRIASAVLVGAILGIIVGESTYRLIIGS